MQLSNIVQLKETVAPKELNHFNRLRAAIITASLAPDYTMEKALTFLETVGREELGPNAQTTLDGESREYRESGQLLLMIFVLALAFIYLVLAAQFESFVSPFIIMLTVPLVMTGALAALLLLAHVYGTGGTLNVYSKVGLIKTRSARLLRNECNPVFLDYFNNESCEVTHVRRRRRCIYFSGARFVARAIALNRSLGTMGLVR